MRSRKLHSRQNDFICQVSCFFLSEWLVVHKMFMRSANNGLKSEPLQLFLDLLRVSLCRNLSSDLKKQFGASAIKHFSSFRINM